MRLDDVLSSRHIPFERLHHRPAYTANRMAQMLHVPGREVAKTVLLRTDQGYVLAVLPATHQIDLTQMRQELGANSVEMATEAEMDRLFPDCERGAIPPFGSMYNLPTLVDESLAEDESITFEAQNHEEALRIAYRDFQEMEHPRMGHFARRS
jgi:Ala-tRNA(Pro) deacylase